VIFNSECPKVVDRFRGSLQRVSYARPGKLFTANSSLMITEAGRLNSMAFNNIINAIVGILQKAVKK